MTAQQQPTIKSEQQVATAPPIDILLVEDNPDDARLVLHALERYRLTNRIHWVRDGAEALELLLCTGRYAERDIERNPKLVLLELKLPLVDGIEVLRRVRSEPRTQAVPIVMMTSSREERDIVESYSLGVNSYIVKPVDLERFTESVREVGLYWLLFNQRPQ